MKRDVNKLYALWLEKATEDKDVSAELETIGGNAEQIYERFYSDLAFGTGGLRGILGAGTGRMNIYNIRKATQGLANYLNSKYNTISVAIAFDSRIKSDLFAKEAASVLAANGITVHIFDLLQPTPVLSYAVRQLGCQSGIMVTASHNPAKYNGYKCYGDDGCQMTDNDANEVTDFISKVDTFDDVKTIDFDLAKTNGAIRVVSDNFVSRFLDDVAKQQVSPGVCRRVPLSVVYTPLHGAGNIPVRKILKTIGVSDVHVVPEQELPDGNFPTAPYPNPEFKEPFNCALKLAKKVNPDILLATDPDCDRLGAVVKHQDDYQLLNGNEIGCLLLNYILSEKELAGTLRKDPLVITTIVTSTLASAIAKKYDCEVILTLTGFKYIGEQITLLAKKRQENRYIFGFEESFGYLSGTHVRDKDAVVSSMLFCEMTAYYKEKGLTLIDVMNSIYDEFGYYLHPQVNAAFEGSKGMETMQKIMSSLRENPPKDVAGFHVIRTDDYLLSQSTESATGTKTAIELPSSNVIAFHFNNGISLTIRPSGTEPKVKGYVMARGETQKNAEEIAAKLESATKELLK